MSTERELIVIRRALDGPPSATAAVQLEGILGAANAIVVPVFADAKGSMRDFAAPSLPADHPVPDLTLFQRVVAEDQLLDGLAAELNGIDEVECAYVKPAAEAPVILDHGSPCPAASPTAVAASGTTPLFTGQQGYLGAIRCHAAWNKVGGRGDAMNIIDVEGGWNFDQEDLTDNQGGTVIGIDSSDAGWVNHGTAVVGEFGGDQNEFGITGISSNAFVRAASIFGGPGSSGAIQQAADLLSPGDVILIELHRPGPAANFQQNSTQCGYIAIEWWPDDYAAILYATSVRGVVVVEAAGNGQQDLDDAIYNTPAVGFPASWKNPFARTSNGRDSGSIIAGAGAPLPGMNQTGFGPERSRLGFSNFGSCLTAQGWGRAVTTTGYGDLFGSGDANRFYTSQFSGTSSASPIVVGAVTCVQGVRRGRALDPLTPASMRSLLESTGSKQTDSSGMPTDDERIGNRPNLQQMLDGLNTVFAIGTDGHLWYLPESKGTPGTPGAWSRAGKNSDDFSSMIAAGQFSDGRAVVFAIGTENHLWYLPESSSTPETPGDWVRADPSVTEDYSTFIAAGNFSNGLAACFAIGTSGHLWYLPESASKRGSMGSWVRAGNTPDDYSSMLAVTNFSDGRLVVFAIGTNGHLWYLAESKSSPGTMGDWARAGNVADDFSSFITAGQLADGRAVCFAIGTDGHLWYLPESQAQAGVPGDWKRGGQVAEDFSTKIVAGNFSDSRAVCFAIGTDGHLWFLPESTDTEGEMGNWVRGGNVDNDFSSQIAVGNFADDNGRLVLYAIGTEGHLWYLAEQTPTSTVRPGTMGTWSRAGNVSEDYSHQIVVTNFRKLWT